MHELCCVSFFKDTSARIRDGTNSWLKIANFSGEFIPNFKKPFDVKRSSDSKYSSLMDVARRKFMNYHLKAEKSPKI